MENKPTSLLVMSLGKALNGMPSSLCGKQVVGSSSLAVVCPSLTKDVQTEHELIRMNEPLRYVFCFNGISCHYESNPSIPHYLRVQIDVTYATSIYRISLSSHMPNINNLFITFSI